MTKFIKTKFRISDLESPSNFQVKEEEKYSDKQKLEFCDTVSHLRESTIWDL